MKLVTETEEQLFKEYPLERQSDEPNPLCIVKFFYPYGRGTWYVTGAERIGEDDYLFYGYVESPINPMFDEFGPFTLKELESVKGPFGGIERDLYYKPMHLDEIKGD